MLQKLSSEDSKLKMLKKSSSEDSKLKMLKKSSSVSAYMAIKAKLGEEVSFEINAPDVSPFMNEIPDEDNLKIEDYISYDNSTFVFQTSNFTSHMAGVYSLKFCKNDDLSTVERELIIELAANEKCSFEYEEAQNSEKFLSKPSHWIKASVGSKTFEVFCKSGLFSHDTSAKVKTSTRYNKSFKIKQNDAYMNAAIESRNGSKFYNNDSLIAQEDHLGTTLSDAFMWIIVIAGVFIIFYIIFKLIRYFYSLLKKKTENENQSEEKELHIEHCIYACK